MNVFEGGNVFKDAQGIPQTQRINQTDVATTVKWLEQVTGLDFSSDVNPETNYPIKWLGSTGKTPTSGDLDLAVDANQTSKANLKAHLENWVKSHGQDPKSWVKLSGEAVHFKTPINGKPNLGFVQTDFMFMPNLEWGTFWLAGGAGSAYKGLYRNVLMSSIAKSMNLKASNKGIIDRSNDQVITMDPNQAAKILIGKKGTVKDLHNVESIYSALSSDRNRDAKLADFKEYLAREGLAEPDQVKESDVNFLARLRDRIVNQGMTSLIENSNPYAIYEAKEPRIPYIEDLVIKKGLTGAREAFNIIKQTAENTQKYATIKWDGSPAVIFGRKPNGEFVLTDKSGATAVGYDGLATSPEMMARVMAQRDANAAAKGKTADRTELTQIYRDIWPYFEAAVPKNFRGYLKGDLLYYPGRSYVEDAGNLVFQPNKMGGQQYRIPLSSPLGQKIAKSKVGIAIHTYMEDPNSPEQPMTNPEKILKPVDGLMATSAAVETLQNLKLNRKLMQELSGYARGENAQALTQLLNPTELRSQQITDLPALIEKFINSLKGTDYSQATPAEFGAWLQSNVSPRKYNNIVEYLNSPRSNIHGMSVLFAIWNGLHDLKVDLQRQLDLQQPGQEGWVFAPPAGRAKLVSRTAGGFADPARKAAAKL
jgi:hypothetical protein